MTPPPRTGQKSTGVWPAHDGMTDRFRFLLFAPTFALLVTGCSGLQRTERKKERKANTVVDPVRRKKGEYFFTVSDPLPSPERDRRYPWDEKYIGSSPRITKEFFRCKGSPSHPFLRIPSGERGKEIYLADCRGLREHSLPIREGKEFVYPILIDLLNFVQEKTGKRVIVTSGHRCAKHNAYVSKNRNPRSKHLIGAEVDFYVEGFEKEPLPVLSAIHPFYAEHKRFSPLKKSDREERWENEEVAVTIGDPDSERDGDNQHGYPCLTIEVKYDRVRNRPVRFAKSSSVCGHGSFRKRRGLHKG
ncbi:MAG: D-Ala-D-Ala carboxypeptidase family metallohydrolase [Simkaniaceae bacterium]|nr:D-Ala-D-Ala carboxypeptidase family metallohydrolase [Simkaniaceae bacterium]